MPNHQAPDFSRLESLRDKFNDTVLATDAAELVLGRAGDDRDLITNWLVHLATQPEESSTHRPRRFLDMSEYPHPSWPCVNPRRPPAWWAVRLENVFHHSGKAVQ